jgi:hypothetical protein
MTCRSIKGLRSTRDTSISNLPSGSEGCPYPHPFCTVLSRPSVHIWPPIARGGLPECSKLDPNVVACEAVCNSQTAIAGLVAVQHKSAIRCCFRQTSSELHMCEQYAVLWPHTLFCTLKPSLAGFCCCLQWGELVYHPYPGVRLSFQSSSHSTTFPPLCNTLLHQFEPIRIWLHTRQRSASHHLLNATSLTPCSTQALRETTTSKP